ncbi:MAG: DegV family protein [Chloroflexi bacterium]|nr:DegV family protein [Chloroflexota bacterium]
MSRIKIVVDSAADISSDLAKRHDIRIVPDFINFGQQSFADDGVALTRQQFYERLQQATELPTTAAPPPGAGAKIFQEGLAEADHVIAFSVASKLSSIYDGMVVAANVVSPEKITVIDSGTLTMAQGWMAIAAAEAAEKGASVEDIKALIAEMRARVRLYAVLDTLEYLRRSGRVGWAQANVGALLQIKPIIDVREGEVNTAGRVRTFEKAIKEMADIAHREAPLERLTVLHSFNPERGQKLLDLVQDIAPKDYINMVDVTPAIGTHVGPNAVGLALIKAKA